MKRLSIIFVAAVALAATTSVKAAPFTVTYTGTVSRDVYGNFLANGVDATGDAFTATYVIDPATPGAIVSSRPQTNDVNGNSGSGDPVISITLTIAGQSFTTPVTSASLYTEGEDNQTEILNIYNAVSDYKSGSDANTSFSSLFSVTNFVANAIGPAIYGGNALYTVQPGDTAYGTVKVGDGNGVIASLQLDVATVAFTGTAVAEARIRQLGAVDCRAPCARLPICPFA